MNFTSVMQFYRQLFAFLQLRCYNVSDLVEAYMEKRQTERISELTRISRERELTEEEKAERAELRKNYLAAFRGSMRAQLESTVVEYPDGSRVPFRDAARKQK